METELNRLQNFNTEFAPKDSKSDFFIGKLLSAAVSAKNTQKKIVANPESAVDEQSSFFNNNSGLGDTVSKANEDTASSLQSVTPSASAFDFSEQPPEYMKGLYAMINKLKSKIAN